MLCWIAEKTPLASGTRGEDALSRQPASMYQRPIYLSGFGGLDRNIQVTFTIIRVWSSNSRAINKGPERRLQLNFVCVVRKIYIFGMQHASTIKLEQRATKPAENGKHEGRMSAPHQRSAQSNMGIHAKLTKGSSTYLSQGLYRKAQVGLSWPISSLKLQLFLRLHFAGQIGLKHDFFTFSAWRF